MNKEKQRIALAKYRGYKDIAWRVVCEGTGMDTWVLCSGIIGKGGCEIPDYGNNLSAMHEVEKSMTDEQWEEYSNILFDITHPWDDCGSFESIIRATCHADAAQRLEAILKTLNLWEQET